MIKAKDNHLRDLDRLRVLRKVELVLALPVGALVSRDIGEVVDPLEDLASRGPERQVVHVFICAAGAIIDILESVVEVAAGVIHAARRGTWLNIVPKIRRDFSSHSSLPYHRQFRPSSIQDLVVMFRQVVVVCTITRAVPVPAGPYQQSGYSQYSSGYMPYQQSGLG